MNRWLRLVSPSLAIMLMALAFPASHATEPNGKNELGPLYDRFAPQDGAIAHDEVPDFQKHVSPLLGRLGCNGRACHGSFQGQGGFQLSLFGYDFLADYKALLDEDSPRIDVEDKLASLILTKPVDADMHDGGKRYEEGGWEYWVLRKWIEAGAPFDRSGVLELERLVVTPKEIQFSKEGEKQQLRVVAHWADGSVEDVTCLSRFHSNDSAIASIDETGEITSGEAGDTHVVVSYDNAVVPIQTLRPLSDQYGENYPDIAANTRIDKLILQKLSKLGIVPSELCSDHEFLRRASLDVTGTLPSTTEIQEFVADTAPDKRSRKIEELLQRPGYAAQWTTFLCDVTGNNDDQLRNFFPNPAKLSNQWYQWVYKRIEENQPYDQLVEGIVTAESRLPDESYQEYCEAMSDACRDQSGEKFAERPGLVHYWARRNFQSQEDRAIGFAYAFLGVRIQCAQCHKHPFDQWSKNDFENFEKLFAGVQARQNTMAPDAKAEYAKMVANLGVDKKLRGNQLRRELTPLLQKGKVVPLPELIVTAPRAPRTKNKGKSKQPQLPKAKLLGGEWVSLGKEDVRVNLMDWLRDENNPYFTKSIVNRIWAQYMGVGIVDPPDDLNLANAPSNAALLDYLADGFRKHNYDLKWIHRQILNSDAYQRSWEPNATNALDSHNFSHAQLRRLSAEATYDAVRMALSRDNLVEEARNLEIPRALTLAGGSARANRQDDQSYALRVFGRSVRESNCDCDRSSEPSLLQKVFLANDSAVHGWLSDPKTSWVAQVADKYDWREPVSSKSSQQKRKQVEQYVQRMKKQLDDVRTRLAQAKEQEQTQLIKALRRKEADAVKRIKTYARKTNSEALVSRLIDTAESDEPPPSIRMTEEQAQWVTENAYLRTLSRQPNSDELDIAVSYLREEDPTTAVEGLVWSLVNTKEFILNH